VKKRGKIFTTIFVTILIMAMLVLPVACTTPQTASSGAATEETAATAAKETVAETSAEETAAKEGKHFEGINIVFDTGGPEGNPWSAILYNGIKDAEKDLGCKVTMLYGDWSPEKMISNFKTALATKPDGIITFGAPGDDALMPLVDEAISNGIIVEIINSPCPKIEAKYKAEGVGFVGAEMYDFGYMLAKAAVEKAGLKAGDRGMVWGLISQPARGERSKGEVDALKEAGLTVDYLEISPDVNADTTLGIPVFSGYVASNPDVKLVITDHGGLTGTFEALLKGAGKGPDDIYAAGFDMSPAIVEGVRNGYIDLVADHEPYVHGYLPIVQLCFAKAYKLAGLHINCGAGLVDKNNIEEIAPLVEKYLR